MWLVAGWEQEDQKLKKDAHIAEFSYDPLVAHSEMHFGQQGSHRRSQL